MANVIQWQMRLDTGRFVVPAGVVAHKILDIGAESRATVPAVVTLGAKLAATGAGAAKLADQAGQAARAVTKLADAQDKLRDDRGRFLPRGGAGGVAPSIGAPDANGRFRDPQGRFLPRGLGPDADAGLVERIRGLQPLRDAAKGSWGATDAEKMIGITPGHLKATEKLTLSQRALRRVLQEVSSIGQGRGLVAINGLIGGYERAAPVIERMRNAASAAMPAVRALGSAAIFAGGAAATLAAGGAIGAGLFAGAVVRAQAEREGIAKGLEIQLKSAEAGQRAMLLATRTADFLGEARAATAGQFNDLLAKGFSVSKVDELVRRMADMKIVDPKADMEGITRAIGQIAGTGKLQGDELNQLAENGLETGAVYDALAKRLGKTRQEIIKLKEAGKIDSDTAIQGIMDAIAAQTGGKAAGAVANEASRSGLSGILRRLENLPGNMLFSIGVNKELDTVKRGLNEVLTYFETIGSTKTADALETVFGSLVKGFFGVDIQEDGGFTKSIDKILELVKNSGPEIEGFSKNVRRGFELLGNALDAVDKVDGLVDDISQLTGNLGLLGDVAGVALKPLELLFLGQNPIPNIDAINAIADALDGIPSRVYATITSLASSAYTWATDIGTQLVAGIEAGVMGAYSRVIDAVSNVAWGAISAAKSILGIKSPSTVFEEIGAFTAIGFERGVANNDNGALESLVAPPDLAAIAGGAAAVAGLAGSGGGISVEVNVDARGATAQDADRIAELVTERIVRELEARAMSVGAAA